MHKRKMSNGVRPDNAPCMLAEMPSRVHVSSPAPINTVNVWFRLEDGKAVIFERSCHVLKKGHRLYIEMSGSRIPLEKHWDKWFLLGHGRS